MGLALKPAAELGFGNVEDGLYAARFKGYTKPQQGQYGMTTRLKFEIVDDEDYQGHTLEQLYGTESKKFYNVVKALAGGEYPEDGGDLDDFVGAHVSITIENQQKGDNVYSNVVGVAPNRRKKKAAPKPAPKPVVDEDAFNVDDDDDDYV